MKEYKRISFYAAFLLVVCYVIFALLAFLQYPMPYSPMRNWLSDLGNPVVNARGARFYNLGILSTALLLMVFFLGLSFWFNKSKGTGVILLRLAQVFGLAGSLCMMMSGIYPIARPEIHAFWSTSLYVMISTAFVLLAALLRSCQRSPVWILVLAVLSAVTVILTGIFPALYVLEWITVTSFLFYVILVGVEIRRWPSGSSATKGR